MKFISNKISIKTYLLTALALIAFAANSILCRLALGEESIDASAYTIIRLISGIAILLIVLQFKNNKKNHKATGSWIAASMLFLYAATFSFAYITLDTGTGALILFAAVQLTMIIVALIKGDRLGMIVWIGVLLAFGGFIYLVMPGVSTPSLIGLILMTIAGIAWGVYSLMGKDSADSLADTAYNFTRTLPLLIIMLMVSVPYFELTTRGIVLAIISGAIASGLGYVIWYSALNGLSATQAAVVQLTVPVLAAMGGVVFMSEVITLRLIVAAAMIVCGVAMVLLKNSQSVLSSKNDFGR